MSVKPGKIPFLTAKWRNLVVVNYEVDENILRPLVPKGTELDHFQDKCFVSMVGFLFENTKFKGIVPMWPYQTFEEINLRFYIKRTIGDEVRRAVCFIKEIVPHRIVAWTARSFYNENYVAFPTTHDWEFHDEKEERGGGRFSYHWQMERGRCFLEASTSGSLKELADESLESFILEHFWGYSTDRDGGTVEYQVWHPSWRYWDVSDINFEADVSALYGDGFLEPLRQQPHSAFVAEGSEVSVYGGTQVA